MTARLSVEVGAFTGLLCRAAATFCLFSRVTVLRMHA